MKRLITPTCLVFACSCSQATCMELRANEQVKIAGITGCDEYDIEKTDGGAEGSPSPTYSLNCIGSVETVSSTCVGGAGCQAGS